MLGLWKSEDGRVLINITDVRQGLDSHKIIQFEVIKGLSEKECFEGFKALYMVSVMPKYAIGFHLSSRVFRRKPIISTTIHPHYIPLFNLFNPIERTMFDAYIRRDAESTLAIWQSPTGRLNANEP